MTGTVRCRGGRAERLVDVDPNVEDEIANRAAIRSYVDRTSKPDVIVLNALIEQRARHGWAIDDRMTMRHLDDGRIMTVDEQETVLGRVRETQARIVAEHRAECPDCETCRQIDREQGRL